MTDLARPRLRRELDEARALQQRLIGIVPPGIDGVDIAAIFHPANELSGDFYELCSSEDGALVGILGDVAGHGIASALLASRLVGEFRLAAAHSPVPGEILTRLGQVLHDLRVDPFATALCFHLSPRGRCLQVANAGHVAPVLVRGTEAWSFHESSRPPLGVVEGQRYAEDSIELRANDLLILMTDGLAECLAPAGIITADDMSEAIRTGPSDLVLCLARLFSAIDGDLLDDATLLGIQVL